jgi:phage gpG-like protein
MNQTTWNGDKLTAKIHAEMRRRVRACCRLVEKRAKELVSISGTGIRASGVNVRRRDGTVKKLRKGSTIYGANPSKPGDPPHKQHGQLRASISIAVDDLIGRIGTNLDYGRWLELGARKRNLAARPWLRRALIECMPQIEAILSAPMNF